MTARLTRRTFLQTSAAVTGGALLPGWFVAPAGAADEPKAAGDRARIGAIGVGGRGTGIAGQAGRYGDLVAIADVDRGHAERANQRLAKGKARVFKDYRELLDDKAIDVVTIGTPDHWHTRICVDTLRAGKDVYCEKPLTLTIEEGKLLCKVAKETGRVFQVGTQQRSEFGNKFLQAVGLVREGRIGKVKRVVCAIGGGPRGGPFRKIKPPERLDWDLWLGQTPKVEYIPERCHGNFRWWYEYSGGKMTDWGAHHVDIAQWAIGMEASGPQEIKVVAAEHPIELIKGMPGADDQYNTATAFQVSCLFPNGVEVLVRDDTANGITFEGDKGTFFVSRGKLTGDPVEALAKDPIPEKVFIGLRKGKKLGSHMGNFFECVRDRSEPVSDVYTHHRALTTCHLANIAIRLGRDLKWDPEAEQILGDKEANAWQSRDQRKGYEIAGG